MTTHLCLGDLCPECCDLEPRCPAPYLCNGRGRLVKATPHRDTYVCRRCRLEFWHEPGLLSEVDDG